MASLSGLKVLDILNKLSVNILKNLVLESPFLLLKASRRCFLKTNTIHLGNPARCRKPGNWNGADSSVVAASQ